MKAHSLDRTNTFAGNNQSNDDNKYLYPTMGDSPPLAAAVVSYRHCLTLHDSFPQGLLSCLNAGPPMPPASLSDRHHHTTHQHSAGSAMRNTITSVFDAFEDLVRRLRLSFRKYRTVRLARMIAATVFIGIVGVSMLVAVYSWNRPDDMTSLMAVLACTDKLFKQHHITYFLDYGALLGAVRHGGPIPWDDPIDIDIGVLANQSQDILDIRGKFATECDGFSVVHRSDITSFIHAWSHLLVRRGAFRVFFNRLYPIYIDVADYELTPRTYLTDIHFEDLRIDYPIYKVLPTSRCVFGGLLVQCPRDPFFVLERLYGADWRVPKRHFKPTDTQKGDTNGASGQEAAIQKLYWPLSDADIEALERGSSVQRP